MTLAGNFFYYDHEVLTATKFTKKVSKREQNLEIHQISRFKKMLPLNSMQMLHFLCNKKLFDEKSKNWKFPIPNSAKCNGQDHIPINLNLGN